MLWSMIGIAVAGPTFEGTPDDVRLANLAWEAGIECTGRTPETAPVVPIARVASSGRGVAGRAFSSSGRLHRIQLRMDAAPGTLAHEVGHAWFNGGASAITEGRTELLAECMADRVPDAFPFYQSDTYVDQYLPDLRTWPGLRDGDDPAAVSAAYGGSWRLFRLLRELFEPNVLWGEQFGTWEGLESALTEQGPMGKRVLDMLEGGAATQRLALGDPDRDGIPSLREELMGLSPMHWDTDRNGWWDGAPRRRPATAIPIPPDGSYVCMPWKRRKASDRVSYGGQVRGVDIEGMKVQFVGRANALHQGASRGQGGWWMSLPGGGLDRNPYCAWHPLVTVIVDGEEGYEGLDAFASLLGDKMRAMSRRIGWVDQRMTVRITDDSKKAMLAARWLVVPASTAQRAMKNEQYAEDLAWQLVSYHWLDRTKNTSVPASAALARGLAAYLAGHKVVRHLDAYGDDVANARRIVKACGGWEPFLAGEC